jgi:endonuclease-3 related protein
MTKEKLLRIYQKLYRAFGPQYWWPAETAFEVAVGAILTQNTSWANVEQAIRNLKKARSLSFSAMKRINEKKLAGLIRPAGYYNIKARRLKNFINFLDRSYQGKLKRMQQKKTALLKKELLSVNGIGEETADSILLYALGKPIFVVDAYTRRMASRHHFVGPSADYQALQRFFMDHLPRTRRLFNEYHALLVKLGKDFCKKTKENCLACPLRQKN